MDIAKRLEVAVAGSLPVGNDSSLVSSVGKPVRLSIPDTSHGVKYDELSQTYRANLPPLEVPEATTVLGSPLTLSTECRAVADVDSGDLQIPP